jgi:hypothetical protein
MAKEITHMPSDPREADELTTSALKDMSKEHKKNIRSSQQYCQWWEGDDRR